MYVRTIVELGTRIVRPWFIINIIAEVVEDQRNCCDETYYSGDNHNALAIFMNTRCRFFPGKR
jgi:hypothetical protein